MQLARVPRRPYSGYVDPRMFSSSATADRYRKHAQRTWSDKTLHYDKTILTLNAVLDASLECFAHLRHVFDEETEGIRWYAKDEVIDSLWATRMDTKASERPSAGPEEEVRIPRETCTIIIMTNMKKAKKCRAKLEKVLTAAVYRTRNVVSQRNRNTQTAKDQAGVDRTLSKIQTFGKQCLELLALSDKQYTQFVPLQRELAFLKSVVHDHDFDGGVESDGDNWSD